MAVAPATISASAACGPSAARAVRRSAVEGAERGHDPVPARVLGGAFQRLVHDRLSGQARGAGGIHQRADGGSRGRVEPAFEPRVLPLQRRRRGKERECQQDAAHERRLPTVITELGEPKSSVTALGAAGSGRQSLPSTTNAY